MNHYIPLPDRSVIEITGNDRLTFLQGIITNDIHKLSPERSLYSCLLTPQGKYLFDFFLTQHEQVIWLDCAADHKEALIKRLTMYKLRSDVAMKDVSEIYEVAVIIGAGFFEHSAPEEGATGHFCKGLYYTDPRSRNMFGRSVIERSNDYQSFTAQGLSRGEYAEYESLRIQQGMPDSTRDLEQDGSFPLQYNMEALNAIDFKKGCYVGQEVTARTKYRGTLRKRLFCVTGDEGSTLPEPGAELTYDGKKIGVLRSSYGHHGLAIAEIETAEALQSGEGTAYIEDAAVMLKSSSSSSSEGAAM